MHKQTTEGFEKAVVKQKGLPADRHPYGATSLGTACAPGLFLQRSIGNQTVGRLLCSGLMRSKLTVSCPDDVYEQEAEQIADEALRMPDTAGGDRQSMASSPNATMQMKPG